jgi:hypothetical protein
VSEFSRGSFGERVTMVCAVCQNNHHEPNREVFVRDQSGVVRRGRCPICCCLDCVQTADDPIRTQLRPLIMGQTLQSQYNLEAEEFDKRKGHTGPVRRKIEMRGPGPLNLRDAMREIQGLLGVQPTTEPTRRIGTTGCGCGNAATSRCIDCDLPLCGKCLGKHKCL